MVHLIASSFIIANLAWLHKSQLTSLLFRFTRSSQILYYDFRGFGTVRAFLSTPVESDSPSNCFFLKKQRADRNFWLLFQLGFAYIVKLYVLHTKLCILVPVAVAWWESHGLLVQPRYLTSVDDAVDRNGFEPTKSLIIELEDEFSTGKERSKLGNKINDFEHRSFRCLNPVMNWA